MKVGYICICILLMGCISDEYSDVREYYLTSVSYECDNILSPYFFTIKNNHLIESSSNLESCINIYNLPEISFIKSYFRKGQGPDDIQLFPMLVESLNENLYIWGFNNYEIRKYNIQNNSLQFVKSFFTEGYENFNQMYIFNDSILLYHIMPAEFKIKKYDLINQKPIGEKKISDRTEKSMQEYFGYIASDGKVIVHVYTYQDKINIYSLEDFKLIKELNFGPHQTLTKDINENIRYNVDVVAGKNYFYVLYQGCTDKEYMESPDKTLIRVFTYKGEYKGILKFDISPALFFVDEKEEYLYGYNYLNNENLILKYHLPDFDIL